MVLAALAPLEALLSHRLQQHQGATPSPEQPSPKQPSPKQQVQCLLLWLQRLGQATEGCMLLPLLQLRCHSTAGTLQLCPLALLQEALLQPTVQSSGTSRAGVSRAKAAAAAAAVAQGLSSRHMRPGCLVNASTAAWWEARQTRAAYSVVSKLAAKGIVLYCSTLCHSDCVLSCRAAGHIHSTPASTGPPCSSCSCCVRALKDALHPHGLCIQIAHRS